MVIVGSRSIYCSIGSRIVNSVFDPSKSVQYFWLPLAVILFLCLFVLQILSPCVVDLHALFLIK